ncbi:MAG: hypothetical protein JNL08_19210 [Planctomycetes bacterium]|nr:hypothetical protein [Planctomycetota bacterium]
MIRLLVPVLFAVVAFAACGESAEARAARKEITEAIDATRDLVLSSLADLKQKAEPQIDRLGEGLLALRAEAEARGQQLSAAAAPLVQKAEASLAEAKQRLSAARDASAEKTAAALAELQASLRSAGEALAAAKQSLQADTPPK